MGSNESNYREVIARLKGRMLQAVRSLPKVLANEAVNWSKENFNRQGFLDTSLEAWPQRKGGKNARPGRAILIQSGRLRRSIRVISISENGFSFGTDVPYARAHNDGFNGSVMVKAHFRSQYRKSKEGTGRYSTKTRKERTRTVSRLSGNIPVKGYTRAMNLPQRKFLGNSANLRLRLITTGRAHILRKIK